MASAYFNMTAGLQSYPLFPTVATPWPVWGVVCQHMTALPLHHTVRGLPIDTYQTVSATDISIFAASATTGAGGPPPTDGGPSSTGGSEGAGGGRPVDPLFAELPISDAYKGMIRGFFQEIVHLAADALLIPVDKRETYIRQIARGVGQYLEITRARHMAGGSPLPPSEVVELAVARVLKDAPEPLRENFERRIASIIYSIALHLAVAGAAGEEIPAQADIDFPGYDRFTEGERTVSSGKLEEMIISNLPEGRAGAERLALVIGPGVDTTDIDRALLAFGRVVVVEAEERQAAFIRNHYRDDPRIEVRDGLVGRDSDILNGVRADAAFASFSLGWARVAFLGGALKRGAVVFFQDISAGGQPTPMDDIVARIGADFDVRFYNYGSPIRTTQISPMYPNDVETLLLKLKAGSPLQFPEDLIDACLDGKPGILKYLETREEARALAAIVHARKGDEQFLVVPHGDGFALYKIDIDGLSLHFARLPDGTSIEVESYGRDGVVTYRIDKRNEHVTVATPFAGDGSALTEDAIVYVTARQHAADPRSTLLIYPITSKFLRNVLFRFLETDATSDESGKSVRLWPLRDAEGRIVALSGRPLQIPPGFNPMLGTFAIPIDALGLPADHPAPDSQKRTAGPVGRFDDVDTAIAAMAKIMLVHPNGSYFVAPIADNRFGLFAKDVIALVDVVDRRFSNGQSLVVHAIDRGSLKRVEITKVNERVASFTYSPLGGKGRRAEREIVVFVWLRNRKARRRERLHFALTTETILKIIRDEGYMAAKSSAPPVADFRVEHRTDARGNRYPHAIVGKVSLEHFTEYEAIDEGNLDFVIPMTAVLGIGTTPGGGSHE